MDLKDLAGKNLADYQIVKLFRLDFMAVGGGHHSYHTLGSRSFPKDFFTEEAAQEEKRMAGPQETIIGNLSIEPIYVLMKSEDKLISKEDLEKGVIIKETGPMLNLLE